MRAARNDDFSQNPPEMLGGHLLLAHPGISDPHFFRSVVLLSHHSEKNGAVGVVINRPLEATLGQHDPDFALGPLSSVPLFEGGPVQTDQLLLVSWLWDEQRRTLEMHFGIGIDKASELLREHPQTRLCGFLGYAGWSAGQLEDELEKGGWEVLPIRDNRLCSVEIENLWRSYALEAAPEWLLDADEPEDTSLN